MRTPPFSAPTRCKECGAKLPAGAVFDVALCLDCLRDAEAEETRKRRARKLIDQLPPHGSRP